MSGKGASINSKWVTNNALYKKHVWADNDQSLKTLMENWFFGIEEEAPPSVGGILVQVM